MNAIYKSSLLSGHSFHSLATVFMQILILLTYVCLKMEWGMLIYNRGRDSTEKKRRKTVEREDHGRSQISTGEERWNLEPSGGEVNLGWKKEKLDHLRD